MHSFLNLDTMKVFNEDNRDTVSQELARLGLGILVACATGNGGGGIVRVSLAAPACALLNSLLHAGGPPISGDADTEAAYLICAISTAMKVSVEGIYFFLKNLELFLHYFFYQMLLFQVVIVINIPF